ncbi:MAG: pyridine nucleotide-disulfide oxidoreductase, partial [Oscillospiraceae bacterium]|nr:pyridine nucleotide-disulfide oxidoreductase [Oscillospiraceae bacterium]
ADYVLKGSVKGDVIRFTNGDSVGYTVPQKLHKETAAEKIDVFFRVRRVFGKSKIVVSSGDTEIQVFKRPFMAPGEMQHIVIPTEKLKGFDTITVSAEEA